MLHWSNQQSSEIILSYSLVITTNTHVIHKVWQLLQSSHETSLLLKVHTKALIDWVKFMPKLDTNTLTRWTRMMGIHISTYHGKCKNEFFVWSNPISRTFLKQFKQIISNTGTQLHKSQSVIIEQCPLLYTYLTQFT